MPRVKRGTIHHKRRKHLIVYAKGFKWGRNSKYAYAKQAVMKALSYNWRDRKIENGQIAGYGRFTLMPRQETAAFHTAS